MIDLITEFHKGRGPTNYLTNVDHWYRNGTLFELSQINLVNIFAKRRITWNNTQLIIALFCYGLWKELCSKFDYVIIPKRVNSSKKITDVAPRISRSGISGSAIQIADCQPLGNECF